MSTPQLLSTWRRTNWSTTSNMLFDKRDPLRTFFLTLLSHGMNLLNFPELAGHGIKHFSKTYVSPQLCTSIKSLLLLPVMAIIPVSAGLLQGLVLYRPLWYQYRSRLVIIQLDLHPKSMSNFLSQNAQNILDLWQL